MPSITITPMYPEHVRLLDVVDVQTDEHRSLLGHSGMSMLEHCSGVTAWWRGKPIGCAGFFLHWRGRAEAWALLGKGMKHGHSLQLFARLRSVLDAVPHPRVEMTVKVNNKHGHKLAKVLGFEREGVLRSFWPNPDGTMSDVVMYARIRAP